jgi:hypothetical protein
MAHPSSHRAVASSIVFALVAGAAVAGGAFALTHLGSPKGASAAVVSSTQTTAWKRSTASRRRAAIRLRGLHKWHAAKVPGPLTLAPAVAHPRRVVTVVRTQPAAAPTATTHATKTTRRRSHAARHHAAKSRKRGDGAQTAGDDRGSGSGSQGASAPAAGAAAAATPTTPAPGTSTTATTTTATTTSGGALTPATITITGVQTVTRVLSVNLGAWTGLPGVSFGYVWQTCNPDGLQCQDMSPAQTQPTYTLRTTDVGLTVRVQVTAKNPSSTATSTSRPTDQIAPQEN